MTSAPGNSFGKALILTTFGESHGRAVGGILDGFPSGIPIDTEFVQTELGRRRPGDDPFSSPRKEEDKLEILSGLYEGISTGAPIAFLVFNRDQRPSDYDHLRDVYRPSHGDFTWHMKFGIRDHRGGGRASARETVARVAGGALAKIFLRTRNITVEAQIVQIGSHRIQDAGCGIHDDKIAAYLQQMKEAGDTVGGIISCKIRGVPPGLGEPVFDKLQADLGKAMLSIGTARGFEYGSGFAAASMTGSEHNDRFINDQGKIRTHTNHSGGIQGGISNGEEIVFRVAFKPVSTLMSDQESVNVAGEPVTIRGTGRHDVCVVPRAVPVVEAMAALVIADHLIRCR